MRAVATYFVRHSTVHGRVDRIFFFQMRFSFSFRFFLSSIESRGKKLNKFFDVIRALLLSSEKEKCGRVELSHHLVFKSQQDFFILFIFFFFFTHTHTHGPEEMSMLNDIFVQREEIKNDVGWRHFSLTQTTISNPSIRPSGKVVNAKLDKFWYFFQFLRFCF